MKLKNVTAKDCELSDKQRETIDNFCADGKSDKHFGQLIVKKYNGNLSTLRELNGTAKNIGTLQFFKTDDCWYFDCINGQKYRYSEKLVESLADGIDTIFDYEFKRKDV